MKSVAIVTIQSVNFGNRLQNYALQEMLKDLNLQVSTLNRGVKPSFMKRLKNEAKGIAQTLVGTKGAKFRKFEKRIKKNHFYLTANQAPEKLKDKYDYFIAGSDQIWNPHYKFVGKSDLLYFADHKQKIAYAASFGVSELPEEKKSIFINYLSDFASLSVRENAGSNIIKELTGKDTTVVLDPTLMLTAEKWRLIERKTNLIPKKKYVLVYALGSQCETFRKEIENYIQSGFEILDIFKKNSLGKALPVGPSEFLYLLDHAEKILTDSFHATVFSILFHKKVCTFPRGEMNLNSRIITLASITELEKCFDQLGNFNVKDEKEYFEVEKILEKNRIKSRDFLHHAFVDVDK